MFTKTSLLIATALILSGCSSSSVPNNADAVVEEQTTTVEETPTAEPSETTETAEPVETIVEENTPEVTSTIIEALETSDTSQQNNGFFEYRSGVEKASSTEFEYVAILTPSEPNIIYFYDSRMGFSAITKLDRNIIQSDYGFQGILEYIEILETNGLEITEEFTFRKETTGDKVEYFFITPLESGENEIKLIIDDNNLISGAEVTNPTSEYAIEYKYGIDGETLRLMNNAFDPNAPVVEEETVTE